jgi:hypothetical protein
MTYDVRRRIAKQWSSSMVQEEADVWWSLQKAGYRYISFCDPAEEDAPRVFDMTPVTTLYDVYREYHRRHGEIGSHELTIQQFGVAFNAVTEGTLAKVRNRIMVNGVRKLVWGYRGVKGPGSHTVRIKTGRPKGT